VEEAYDTIARELKRVRAKDPRKFVWFNGFSRAGSMLEGMEFCEAFGTPNYIEVDGRTARFTSARRCCSATSSARPTTRSTPTT